MEARARLLLEQADEHNYTANKFRSLAKFAITKERGGMAWVHTRSERMLRRKAEALRREAARLAEQYFDIQPIAEPIGEHQAAPQAAMA